MMNKIKTFLLLVGICIVIPHLAYSYSPPQAGKTFYGDADGDMSVGGTDMPIHKKASQTMLAAYDTLQPNNLAQQSNTGDIDGDNSCGGTDIPLLKMVSASKIVSANFNSWGIVNIDLPEAPTELTPDTDLPFRLSVRADKDGGPTYIGRAGMIVKVEVTNAVGTVTLSGRHCDPDTGGSGDQLNSEAGASGANDQCALGVAITNYTGTPPYGGAEVGATEDGTYGLQVNGSSGATATLKVTFPGQILLNIPATEINIDVVFEAPTVAIDCWNPGPNPVNVGQTMYCTLTATGGNAVVDSGADTCGGGISGGFYEFTPGEPDEGSCTAAVMNDADNSVKDSNIVIVNNPPDIPYWTTLPSDVTVDGHTSYDAPNGVAADNDLPNAAPGDPGYVSCSYANNICSFGVTVTGEGAGTATCNLSFNAGDWEICTVDIRAYDGFGGYASQNITITVEQSINISNCTPNPVDEGVAVSCDVTAVGGTPEVDAANDDCGGAINGAGPWTYDFTPTEAQGPGACDAAVQLVELNLIKDYETVTINEVNQAPSWTTMPTDVTVRINGSHDQANGAADDGDEPNSGAGDPGYLTCSAANNTCVGFTPVVNGSGAGAVACNLSFTAGSSPETCTVDVVVTDGNTAQISQNITISVKDVWYVNDDATGAGTGFNWADAFDHVMKAVEASTSGEMIWVAEGTYTMSLIGTDPVLIMKDGVDIYGGFQGTENSLGERGNPADYPAILDGEDMSYNVVLGSSFARLDGFTIENGFTYYSAYAGAGMRNSGVTDLEISNCIFTSNTAVTSIMSGWDGFAGGMYNGSSSLTITDCTFSDNSSGGGGGGIYNSDSDTLIIDSTFHGNSDASHFSGFFAGQGGGMFNVNSSPTLINCIFTGNTAGEDVGEPGLHSRYGGAIYNNGSSSNPVIFNCSFSGNTAFDAGGAIYNSDSSPTLTNCILWDDTAPADPEIYNDGTSTPSVTYSDIEGGYATGEGNIDLDPMFVATDDLHLQLGSPCIDTGTPTGAPSDDLDGNPRPSGLEHDMGAYEYQFECDDGIDNDGDTFIDWPDDSDCESLIDDDEACYLGPPDEIVFVSAVPMDIGVKGSGLPETSTVTFKVINSQGNPVSDPYEVIFSIAAPPTTPEPQPGSAFTVNGLVSTSVSSGYFSGSVSVTATLVEYPGIFTSASGIYIHPGVPAFANLSAAIEAGRNNLPGLYMYGVQGGVTAFVGDRYNNPVAMGTIVYFTSEAGIIGALETPTNQYGQATTWLETAGPAPWDTAWEAPYNTTYNGGLDFPYGEYWLNSYYDPQVASVPVSQSIRDQWDTQHGGSPSSPWDGFYHLPNPMDGKVTVLVMTLGEEYFFDENSNGEYDLGEYYIDLSEPYVDANDNGQWDPGESFRDNPPGVPGNTIGQYDGPNGQWDGIDSDGLIMIWNPIHFIFSGSPGGGTGESWKQSGDYQQCLSTPEVDLTCWVSNYELIWEDWEDSDSDGILWETDATNPNGYTVGGAIGPACIDMVAVFCDRYHNPVSPVNFPEFEIDSTGQAAPSPDSIPNFGGGGGEFDCHYHFNLCDADPADSEPPAPATVQFKTGAYYISASGTGD